MNSRVLCINKITLDSHHVGVTDFKRQSPSANFLPFFSSFVGICMNISILLGGGGEQLQGRLRLR